MFKPIVFDVETKRSFREVENNNKKLGVSVAVLYDYTADTTHAFTEKNIRDIFAFFEKASLIIGFNSNSFDLTVLSPYYVGDLMKLPRLDLLESIKGIVGRRYALNDLVQATLNKAKSGHGLRALELYREGKIEELTSYCRDDVLLTKELFDYGCKNGYVRAPSLHGTLKIVVNWKSIWEKYSKSIPSNHNLTLGF